MPPRRRLVGWHGRVNQYEVSSGGTIDLSGYQQPTDVTYPPARRAFALLAGLIAAAIETGELAPPGAYTELPRELEASLEQLSRLEGHHHPPVALYLAASVWARLHGIVMLELFHLLQPVVGDTEAFYRVEVLTMLRQIGLQEVPGAT